MNIPVKFTCICGKQSSQWLDFNGKAFLNKNYFFHHCWHTGEETLGKAIIIMCKDAHVVADDVFVFNEEKYESK